MKTGRGFLPVPSNNGSCRTTLVGPRLGQAWLSTYRLANSTTLTWAGNRRITIADRQTSSRNWR